MVGFNIRGEDDGESLVFLVISSKWDRHPAFIQ